jgi:hypothetical protein
MKIRVEEWRFEEKKVRVARERREQRKCPLLCERRKGKNEEKKWPLDF